MIVIQVHSIIITIYSQYIYTHIIVQRYYMCYHFVKKERDNMIEINLQEIVNRKNLTMTQIHNATGISKNTLSLMNTGVSKGIQFDTLNKLLDFLEVELDELLIYTSSKKLEKLTVDIKYIDSKPFHVNRWEEPVYEPPTEGVSEEEAEKMERSIIFHEQVINIKQNILLEIIYEEVAFKFTVETVFSASTQYEEAPIIQVFFKELYRHLNLINFDITIRRVIEEKLVTFTQGNLPKEFLDFIKINNINVEDMVYKI